MGRKKQFINKKTAQHFHVVHRSQRDPKANDPEASKYVLLSSTQQGVELRSDSEYEDSDDEMPDLVDTPAPKGENSLKPTGKESKPAFPVRKVRFGSVEAEDLVDENGLPRDGYDYSQHMKEMGHGKFYSATSRFDASEESRAMSRHVELPKDALPSGEEQERLLDAITLTTDVMDEDLREALVNDSAFEELDDNFVLQAAEEKEAEGATDDFDYDAHIAKLMEAASGVPKFRGNLTDSEDEDEFSDDDSEELSDDGGEVETPQERDEAQRVLDELFEKTLAEEYDDEQLGELEEDDPETRGEETLDGALLEAVIEDYAAVQQELADAEGKLGNPLRTGNRLQQVLEECEAERRAYEEDENATTEEEEEQVEEDLVARAEREEKEIQELYERNKYLQREEREQWDCETIVSTYSTLDNHPTVLREEAPRRKKKKQVVAITTAVNEDIRTQKVTLSRKTGMPLGVFETAAPTHNKGFKAVKESVQDNRRQKGETKEEKRARKAAVKMEKMARRAEKKETKLAFKEEEARQSTQTVAGRVSVFKY